jgi:hypothetical protein
MSIQDWEEVLTICHMWQMDELRASTILAMEAVFTDESASSKLRIAYDHQIEHWKYPTVVQLVLRTKALDIDDIDILGSQMASWLMEIREYDIHHARQFERRFITTVGQSLIKDNFALDPPVAPPFGL